MINPNEAQTEMERYALWRERYSSPKLFHVAVLVDIVEGIVTGIVAKMSTPPDLYGFAFMLGVDLASYIFTIVFYIWHKEGWIKSHMMAMQKEKAGDSPSDSEGSLQAQGEEGMINCWDRLPLLWRIYFYPLHLADMMAAGQPLGWNWLFVVMCPMMVAFSPILLWPFIGEAKK